MTREERLNASNDAFSFLFPPNKVEIAKSVLINLKVLKSMREAGEVQGVHLILCFFEDFKIYSGLCPLSVSPRFQCVYTMAGQTPALQQNWQSSEKSQHFKEKHNI